MQRSRHRRELIPVVRPELGPPPANSAPWPLAEEKSQRGWKTSETRSGEQRAGNVPMGPGADPLPGSHMGPSNHGPDPRPQRPARLPSQDQLNAGGAGRSYVATASMPWAGRPGRRSYMAAGAESISMGASLDSANAATLVTRARAADAGRRPRTTESGAHSFRSGETARKPRLRPEARGIIAPMMAPAQERIAHRASTRSQPEHVASRRGSELEMFVEEVQRRAVAMPTPESAAAADGSSATAEELQSALGRPSSLSPELQSALAYVGTMSTDSIDSLDAELRGARPRSPQRSTGAGSQAIDT